MINGLKQNPDSVLSLSTYGKNGVCNKEEEETEDSYPDQSVFNEPRHIEQIEGLKGLPNQNWRSKERVSSGSLAPITQPLTADIRL